MDLHFLRLHKRIDLIGDFHSCMPGGANRSSKRLGNGYDVSLHSAICSKLHTKKYGQDLTIAGMLDIRTGLGRQYS